MDLGRGPGTTPGDPRKFGDARTPYDRGMMVVDLLETGGRGGRQSRILNDFEVISESRFNDFWIYFGS